MLGGSGPNWMCQHNKVGSADLCGAANCLFQSLRDLVDADVSPPVERGHHDVARALVHSAAAGDDDTAQRRIMGTRRIVRPDASQGPTPRNQADRAGARDLRHSVTQRMARVSTTTFLDRLDIERQRELLALGRVRRYPAHSIVFFDGDEAHDVVIVRAGQVKVSVTLDGHEVLLDVLSAGDVLGELSAIDGGPRSATATALTDTDVSVITADAFSKFIHDHGDVAVVLMRSVAGRLRNASRRQVEYGALDAVGRVCRRLVEMIDRYGRPAEPGVVIEGPLSQTDIAAWAGLSREAVVKSLRALRALGWVTTTARGVTVVDVDAVTTRASISLG